MKKITKKERFLEASLELIHEKGFKATTMRDIAQKLNFEVANVYNYIDSKQSLLETYLFSIQDEFQKAMLAITTSTLTPTEQLKMVIASYIQITERRPLEQALLANEWRNLKEPRLGEFIIRRNDYEYKLKKILQDGVEQGAFRNMDVEITTHVILSSLRWLYLKYLNSEDKANTVEIEKQLVDFIQNGITRG